MLRVVAYFCVCRKLQYDKTHVKKAKHASAFGGGDDDEEDADEVRECERNVLVVVTFLKNAQCHRSMDSSCLRLRFWTSSWIVLMI